MTPEHRAALIAKGYYLTATVKPTTQDQVELRSAITRAIEAALEERGLAAPAIAPDQFSIKIDVTGSLKDAPLAQQFVVALSDLLVEYRDRGAIVDITHSFINVDKLAPSAQDQEAQ